MNKILTLTFYELKSFEYIKSSVLILIVLLSSYLFLLKSKTMQLIVLLLSPRVENITYFHYILFYFLVVSIPTVLLYFVSDSVSNDFKTKKIKLLIPKIKRSDYLLAKLLSRFIVVLVILVVLLVIAMFYSINLIGTPFFNTSLKIFVLIFSMSFFLCNLFLFTSTISKNPLLVNIIFIVISGIITNFSSVNYLSFYHYLNFEVNFFRSAVILNFSGLFILMNNIVLFSKKRF